MRCPSKAGLSCRHAQYHLGRDINESVIRQPGDMVRRPETIRNDVGCRFELFLRPRFIEETLVPAY